MKKIKGLIVAPFTGFTADEELNLSVIMLQADFYKNNGITGAFIAGTTGEGSSLTMDEKKALYREWAKYKDDNFALIGFVGGTSVKECRELALYARECGLDAVAMTAPYYQKASDVKALARTLAQVASVVPDMPFFFYHIPSLTHVGVNVFSLLKEMDAIIPNLAGIKYTFEDMMDYQLCLDFKDRKYTVMWGRDEMLLEALAIGADTFVGSTYGYNAPVYNKIREAFAAGDIKKAAALQHKACEYIQFLGKYGNGCGKAFMKAVGVDLGPCRFPLSTLAADQYESLLEDLAKTDFNEYKCVL